MSTVRLKGKGHKNEIASNRKTIKYGVFWDVTPCGSCKNRRQIPVKYHLGLRTPGVYWIPCECGRVYIGQTDRSLDIKLKEHQGHIRLQHPDKSAVAEHSIDQGHRFEFHNSSFLDTKTRYMDHIVRETIEIELHPYNINREVPSFLVNLGSLLSAP
jgi:hypothetical protein